jgi:hypothetical protein
MMWSALIDLVSRILGRHKVVVTPEVPPLPIKDKVELRVLQSFDRELQARFRSLQADAEVIARRRLANLDSWE